MSQHSSLKMDSVGARHRNVLKRHERVSDLHKSENWGNRESAFRLPKVKLIKIKVKKEKAAKEEAGTEGAAAAATPAAAQAAPKAASAGKPAQDKTKTK